MHNTIKPGQIQKDIRQKILKAKRIFDEGNMQRNITVARLGLQIQIT